MGTVFRADHTVLVTGASSGIGAATAAVFARRGARVALHYNHGVERCRKVAAAINEAGGAAEIFQADLTDPAACRLLASTVLKQYGRIDTLVNNAGILGGRRPFLEITEDLLQNVLDTNLKSAFIVSQAVVPQMIERGAGSIINVSSIAGRNGGSRGVIAYAISKGGLTAMTKGMARELITRGVRVNAVNPGVIHTPLHERSTPPAQFEQLTSQIPQGRPGTAEEVAEVIAFLASPAAAHIVGESIEVNGGILML